jgi:hypothetical protein
LRRIPPWEHWGVRSPGSRFGLYPIRITGKIASVVFIAGLVLLPAQGSFATGSPASTTTTTTSVVSPVIPPPPLKATHVSRPAVLGRTIKLIISGTGFYGRPRILTGTASITALVLRDTGTSVTVRVRADLISRRGTHLFTIVLLDGKRTEIRFQLN